MHERLERLLIAITLVSITWRDLRAGKLGLDVKKEDELTKLSLAKSLSKNSTMILTDTI